VFGRTRGFRFLLAGEPMEELCREFGTSHKTGYKIFDRYRKVAFKG
jgi:hypothetical protein